MRFHHQQPIQAPDQVAKVPKALLVHKAVKVPLVDKLADKPVKVAKVAKVLLVAKPHKVVPAANQQAKMVSLWAL
jgi:hypothetical protein